MRPAIKYTHGQPGSRIHGSRYYRGYCRFCGQAIRVHDPEVARVGACECDECRGLCRNERGRLRAAPRTTTEAPRHRGTEVHHE